MSYRALFPALVALSLAACGNGTNPFDVDDTGTETPSTSRDGLLPGTTNPSASGAIQRYEDSTGGGGAGSATGFEYRSASDTFYVDNLPFDGDNTYARSARVSTLGGGAYQLYESDATYTDPTTGNVENNFDYRAIYGKSTSGGSQFAIVRSGDYAGYGFGGFIYQRNAQDNAGNSTALVVPTCTGDCTASYSGAYAGLRVFQGRGGIEYVQGDASMTIDFEDFNDGQAGAVLYVRNRRLFDSNGNDVTGTYLTALEALDATTTITNTGGGTRLPNMVSTTSADTGDTNGEFTNTIGSQINNSNGTVTALDSGNYYAILSGAGSAQEVVGVLVVESADPRVEGTFVQETGGFILYRN
ncbi:hypothetical protein ATO6_08600 [Oceanicola sp. 22II-s10i]|uniref:hypothetical protein n=1 Tax=Oceanicola sp. 22II-s10i TaxID=1317116 RepID=UPI000B648208|nr:hypothetical protein [Oceanicola sp. 22II-s10i]OWU85096.1 hypothetical protein ATO6_08600 [Oceanicola sp. 22II-s10i]